ncbi:hypothetical protein BWR60_32235 [Inquilinus limosus]|uniref:Uncharacterized protein n=1 Tax=Inquilinus limosus TaxID=171674 RepID=A0A211Z2J7_9PROT|nr:hypothetical protein BWR60_32235 [Inquilinus limosus]
MAKSEPVPPLRVSPPAPPRRVSLPSPPLMISAPSKPISTSAWDDPVMLSLPEKMVASIAISPPGLSRPAAMSVRAVLMPVIEKTGVTAGLL